MEFCRASFSMYVEVPNWKINPLDTFDSLSGIPKDIQLQELISKASSRVGKMERSYF
jgi:hypothetical protein